MPAKLRSCGSIVFTRKKIGDCFPKFQIPLKTLAPFAPPVGREGQRGPPRGRTLQALRNPPCSKRAFKGTCPRGPASRELTSTGPP